MAAPTPSDDAYKRHAPWLRVHCPAPDSNAVSVHLEPTSLKLGWSLSRTDCAGRWQSLDGHVTVTRQTLSGKIACPGILQVVYRR